MHCVLVCSFTVKDDKNETGKSTKKTLYSMSLTHR